MELITPGIGMIFWSVIFFLILLFVLGRFAWPAILAAIAARNESIQRALEAADRARKEMKMLQANNEKILTEAKAERDAMMKETRETREKMINEAREQATSEADKMIKGAREAIQSEKAAAINEMKQEMARLSVEIAEKLLRQKLSDNKEQQELAKKLVDDLDLN